MLSTQRPQKLVCLMLRGHSHPSAPQAAITGHCWTAKQTHNAKRLHSFPAPVPV